MVRFPVPLLHLLLIIQRGKVEIAVDQSACIAADQIPLINIMLLQKRHFKIIMLGAFPVRQVICPGTGILVIQENIIFIFRAMNVVMDPGSFSTPDTVFPFLKN